MHELKHACPLLILEFYFFIFNVFSFHPFSLIVGKLTDVVYIYIYIYIYIYTSVLLSLYSDIRTDGKEY